jgi:ubiquinone/menaquinone biosynthesis C-methylase UbiE
MAHADAFPAFYPLEARRPFGHDEAVRRMAKIARFSAGCRLLHLGCGSGATTVMLAHETGCSILAADSDAAAVEKLQERVRTSNLGERVQHRVVDFKKLPFPDAEFDGIVLDGGLPMRLSAAMTQLRRLLAPKGRLCIVYPVKVGREQAASVVQFWERRLAEALQMPREALQVMESAGYEPHSVETLPDVELAEFYRSVEAHSSSVSDPERAKELREELALQGAQSGAASVTFAQLIGRRKEAGEKPPPSRSEG